MFNKYKIIFLFIGSNINKKEELHKNWLKLTVAHQWSNLYHAYSIPIKQRNIGTPYDNKDIYANVEHNRWLMEKLLLGYRKPTAKEMEEILSDESKALEYKNKFVHKDICPYSVLNDSDKEKNTALAEGISLI